MAFVPVHRKPFVWVDTETTGLDENRHDIIDIAIIRVNPDGAETVFASKVKMDRPENAEPGALVVNGYTEAAWEGAPSSKEVFESLRDRGFFENCLIAGQNVGFDIRFIKATAARVGVALPALDYHNYDTVTLALAFLKPYLVSASLEAVAYALDIPFSGEAHTALADCRMAMDVHTRLTTATDAERAAWAVTVPPRVAAFEAAKWAKKKAAR